MLQVNIVPQVKQPAPVVVPAHIRARAQVLVQIVRQDIGVRVAATELLVTAVIIKMQLNKVLAKRVTQAHTLPPQAQELYVQIVVQAHIKVQPVKQYV